MILGCGADIHDATDNMAPENINLFRQVYDICESPIIGIDFIAEDLTVPHQNQKSAILEVNSVPYIDMHHYPVTGQQRDVAGKILDYYLSQLKERLLGVFLLKRKAAVQMNRGFGG